MSKKALYRKYRSTSFSEILGQDHIVQSLEKAIVSGAVSHAYLFTGPRGVGKTSIARLLAHKIIDADYEGDNPNHIDIIEIDAASNTGVDDVRELREKAYISPAQAKYKVYIIDEVHMLSKAAFNALLKILEEPPAHVIFILATTEVHKVPETVASRTQRFGFRPISQKLLAEHISTIAKKEKIKIDTDAAELVAIHSNGSFRDAISLLDQLQHSGDITTASIRATLGQLDETRLHALTEAVAAENIAGIIDALDDAYAEGAQPLEIAQQLARHWRKELLAGTSNLEHAKLLDLIEQLLNIGNSTDPDLQLEVILIKSLREPKSAAERQPIKAVEQPPIHDQVETAEPTSNVTPKPTSTFENTITEEQWLRVLNRIKEVNNSLYALVRMSHMKCEKTAITLTFGFPFHHRRMQETRNLDVLGQALQDEFGVQFEITCLLDEASKKPVPEPAQKPDKSSDIIGVLGGEMVNL